MALMFILLLGIAFSQTYIELKPSLDFSPCNCDLTVNSCDAYCCCDEKCIIETSDNDQESIVDIWRANDECLPEGTDRDIYSATDCFKSTVNPKLDDL